MPSPKSAVRETVVYKTVVKGGVSASSIIAALGSQSQNQVLASPNGSSGAMSVRALVSNDIPNLAASKITSGIFGLARGGTGADLSATGGSGHVVMQESAAGVFTVRALLSSDIPAHTHTISQITDAGTMASQNANNVAITGGAGAFTSTLSNIIADSATNAVSTVFTLGHNTSGTPAAGYGSRIVMQLESATVADRDAATIEVRWVTATDATRSSAIDFYNVISGTTTRVMSISNARVGINQPSPVYPLDVTGEARVTTNLYVNVIRGSVGSAGGFWGMAASAANVGAMVAEVATQVVMITRGFTSHSADLQQWQTSTQTVLSSVAAGGMITAGTATAGTNDTVASLTIRRNSTGTPAAGFASQVAYQLESSTTENVAVGNITTSWVVATHASRTVRQVYNLTDSAATREIMRMEVNGSAPMIGFNGSAAVAQSTGWAVTNPATRKTFDTTTVTLPQLAEVVGTMIAYFISRGDYAA